MRTSLLLPRSNRRRVRNGRTVMLGLAVVLLVTLVGIPVFGNPVKGADAAATTNSAVATKGFLADRSASAKKRQFSMDHGYMRLAAISQANSQVGQRYVWGGKSRRDGGFDCSGLVANAITVGTGNMVALPAGDAHRQINNPYVKKVNRLSQLRGGDLIYWTQRNGYVYHIALYVGNGQMIVAPATGQRVKYAPVPAKGVGYAKVSYPM